jgi:cyclic beta-1,2-glucan synthetase
MFRKPKGDDNEKPFQAEFFSVERLEQYAQTLAAEHETVAKKGRAQLLPRLEDNGRKLEAVYKSLVVALRTGRPISPAAEWLVDNYIIIDEQLREIREDLPKSYYHELPKLASGELAGYPRIYSVALALIAHTDSRLDTNTLRRFIIAYQQKEPLSIGELWAVAITLRLALVENLHSPELREVVIARDHLLYIGQRRHQLSTGAERQECVCPVRYNNRDPAAVADGFQTKNVIRK